MSTAEMPPNVTSKQQDRSLAMTNNSGSKLQSIGWNWPRRQNCPNGTTKPPQLATRVPGFPARVVGVALAAIM
jgi:hypothetical protein